PTCPPPGSLHASAHPHCPPGPSTPCVHPPCPPWPHHALCTLPPPSWCPPHPLRTFANLLTPSTPSAHTRCPPGPFTLCVPHRHPPKHLCIPP
ncbi:hypothetical protein K439DRAFT_1334506, partial [Ramaria rubella]